MIVTAMIWFMGLITLWDDFGPERRRFRFRENCISHFKIKSDVDDVLMLMDEAVIKISSK